MQSKFLLVRLGMILFLRFFLVRCPCRRPRPRLLLILLSYSSVCWFLFALL